MTITPEMGERIVGIVLCSIVLSPIICLVSCLLVQDKNQPLGKYTAYEVEKASGDWFRVDT